MLFVGDGAIDTCCSYYVGLDGSTPSLLGKKEGRKMDDPQRETYILIGAII